jgi:hypothetical protein
MEKTLPIVKESATQITYVTTTGVEKILTIIGISTVALLSLIGIVTIIILVIKAILNGRKKQ